jgi:hypothetical protein
MLGTAVKCLLLFKPSYTFNDDFNEYARDKNGKIFSAKAETAMPIEE